MMGEVAKLNHAIRWLRLHKPEELMGFTIALKRAKLSYTSMTTGEVRTRRAWSDDGLEFLAFTGNDHDMGVVLIHYTEMDVEYIDMAISGAKQNFGTKFTELYEHCKHFDEELEQVVAMDVGEAPWQ